MEVVTRLLPIFPRSARPVFVQLRGMAVGSGSGVDVGVGAKERAIYEANLEEDKQALKRRIVDLADGRPLHKEPFPTSSMRSTASLGNEVIAEQEHQADQQRQGIRGPAANASSELKPGAPTMVDKVSNFVKESITTLTNGVNNAGQPEVKDKLKS